MRGDTWSGTESCDAEHSDFLRIRVRAREISPPPHLRELPRTRIFSYWYSHRQGWIISYRLEGCWLLVSIIRKVYDGLEGGRILVDSPLIMTLIEHFNSWNSILQRNMPFIDLTEEVSSVLENFVFHAWQVEWNKVCPAFEHLFTLREKTLLWYIWRLFLLGTLCVTMHWNALIRKEAQGTAADKYKNA